jgi:cell wall assembly regulator SMI1
MMSELHANLEAIAEWHREHNPPSALALQPPLSRETLQTRCKKLPFELPEVLIQLYLWHNGQRNNSPFFGAFTFYPLEEALEEYALALESAEKGEQNWKKSWFPVFGFQGDFFVIDLAYARGESPVWLLIGSETEVPCWYDNLTTMIATLRECFETGACYLDEDEILVEDFELSEQIRLRRNQQVDRFSDEAELEAFEPVQEVEDYVDGSRRVTTRYSEQQYTVEIFGPDQRKRQEEFFWGDELRRKDVWEYSGPSEATITSENYSGMVFCTRAHVTILPGGEVLTQRVETIIDGEVVSEEDFRADFQENFDDAESDTAQNV